MAGTAFFGLVGANPTASVLDNLKNASRNLKSTLNDALNSALKSQLSDMLTKASLPVIAGLVGQMPSADIVAASTLTVQAFAKQQLNPMVVKDPAMQQAVDAELANLSNTTTIGALLQLDTPLASHSLFKADVMKADIASLLATSPTIGQNQQLQADFIDRYSASTGTIQDFWKQLSSDPEFKAAVPELQFTLQLGTLTLNNSLLVSAIRKQYNPKSMRDLTAVTPSAWAQLITSNNISIPASISGANPAEKTTNYVNAILGALRSAFPTDYIAQNLGVNPHDKFDQEVAQFLKRAPQFNLITTNLQQFIAHNPTALAGIPAEDKNTFLRRLGGYQRLTRLNSDPQIVTALASKGLDSAYKISSLPRSAFLSQYSQLLEGSDKAQAVYASAQRITASTTNFYMTVCEGLSNSHPWVFGDVSKEVSAAVQQIPNWQELFGSTSACACQDCRSVLSAAAYFGDLLHFLSQAHIDPNNPNSNTLLGILAGRRPDLVNLKLNCENTNTTLPYLDLVNEILESVVMTHVGDPPRPPAHDTPPDATPDQLSVNPEFTNDAAYLLLANALYPFSLPFDRFLEIARTYLEFAGSSLYEIMKAFQIGIDPAVPANPTPSDQTIALEYVKISNDEFLILTGQPFRGTSPLTSLDDLAEYYGYNPPMRPANWPVDLAAVPNFLQRTGITYDDLVALLATHFVNPVQRMTLQATNPQDLCDIQTTVITNLLPLNVDRPDLSAVHNIYRFLRLRSKLGWSIPDLDRAIRALGATDIDAPFLLKLSQLKRFQDQLNLSIAEALALWANIDTEGSDSLYLSLFQNKGAVNPLDPTSALRYTYTLAAAPASGLSFLDPYAARISYSAGQLQFTGAPGTDTPPQPQPMTLNQERFLLSLSTDANYQYAVKQLFLQSQSYPQNPVSLASLPAGFSLPTQLPDAIYYQGNQLFIISQMSDAFRTQLKGLSTDSNYQLGIDNLYAMRWAPGTEVAVATQALASQVGQLIPVQTIPAHANTLLAALRISAVDLAAIIAYLWNQSARANPVLTPSNTGGSLAKGKYYVKVSVTDAFGERLYASETAVTVTGPNGSIAVSWAPMPGAISYNVYYTMPDAGAGSESLKISPAPPTATSATITTSTTGGSVFPATAFPLNLTNLSAVFRYARLARALSISAADLLSLNQLIGINPFQPSVPGTPATPGTIEFVAKAQELLRSKFSVAQLNYIYRNVAAPSAGLAPQQSDLDQFVSSLQTVLTAPATEKSPTSDPTGQLLQQYLTAVLEPADVSELMQIINGTVQFSASLQALPPITFPPSLQALISFSGGNLTLTGPMSAAQEAQLLALSADANYQNAIRNLFQQTQPAWARLYTSAPSPAPMPAVSFPAAFRGTGSNAVPFSVGSTPVISSVTPPAAQAPAPVTITGANFGSSQGASVVTLNGSPITTVNSWNDTQIQFTVSAAASSGNIVVTVGGNASNAVPFSVGTVPAISSVTPPAGQALTPVTIAGVNFGATGTLTLNGSPVPPTNWSPTQIQFAAPAGASSGNLVVTVGGNSSNAVPFSVGTMPTISSVSPPAIHAAPSVTIAGANFGSSQGTSTVTLNGAPLTVNSWNDTQIVVTVLTGAASGNLVVTVGGNASNAVPLSIGTAPMISSVSPLAAPLSASVTIIGVNFGTQQGASAVTVNGVAVTQVNSWSDSQISIVVPAGAANGNIVVTVAGNASNAVPFTVGTTPVISSFTPSAGQVLPIVVTIAGANFGSSQGTVALNGAPLTVNRWSNAQITVTIPAGAATGNIVVTAGGNASNAVQFSVTNTPVISSVLPPEVQVPSPVTIAGVNFGAQQGTSAVTLNGSPVAVTSWSDTQIGINLPAGATSGNIVVSVGALIAIDPTNSFVTFLGPMSADQEIQLLALSTDSNYQAAIQDLFQQSKSVWTATHTFALAALPIVVLPNLNSGVISFTPPNPPAQPTGSLQITGSLSDADEATLLALSSDPAYQQEVESLYFQPRQFIVIKLFFLDTGSLIAKLINDPSASIADKYGFVLNSLLSSIGLIVQAVSSGLNLNAALVRLLIVGGQSASSPALLKAFVDPNLAAIADFFALLGNGLSATYFPSPNFGGTSQMSNDPAIDFNWSPTSPPLPGLDPNAFSAKWTGQLLPGFSETYTFDVRFAPPGGKVTTNGTTINLVSGATFNAAWVGATIYINGVAYAIQSVAANGSSLTVRSSAGVQGIPVPYYVPPSAGAAVVSLLINGQALPLSQLQAGGSNPPPPNAGPPSIDFTATTLLSAGVLTSIELDYPNASGSMLTGLQLSWSSLSTPKSVIAQHQLYANPTFSFDKPLGTFKLLSRIALLVNIFRITLGDLTYLSANPAFEGVDPNNPNDPTKAAPFNLGALPSGPSSYIPALFNQWERLLALFTLRDALPTGDSGLLALFQAAGSTPALNSAALISAIATATAWDPSELGVLLGSQGDPLISASIGFSLAAGDFVDERWLVRLRSCFALMTRFGVSSKQLFEWAALGANPYGTVTTNGTTVTWVSGANFSTAWTLATIYINGVPYGIQLVGTNTLTLATSAGVQNNPVPFYVAGFTLAFEPNVARDIQAAIKAKYDDSTWVKVGKKLNDGLREASRDALVAYILAPPAKWELAVDSITTADLLYEYFLIDVEMGACMQTSRIVQAASAVQLFVQRCLMNLEQGISPAAIDTTAWQWIKNYRVWQANREVFLYPEDWIDPTLRDDKTPFFKDLESELRQNPITPDTVEQAIRNYLEKLDQVARLEICATYYYFDPNTRTLPDGTDDTTNDVIHVFARTFSAPHVYYYRRLVNASQYGQDKSASYWTPWENIHVDVQGDHLIPVVWNGHLYLFWPVFSEVSGTQPPDASPLPPGKTTQIQLAWSKYGHGKWSAKQVSTDTVVPSYMPLIAGTVAIAASSEDVSWGSGSLFSGSWVGKTIMIATGGGSGSPIVYSPFTIEKVNGPTSLTLTTPAQTTMGKTSYYLAASSYYIGALDGRWFTFSRLATPTNDDLTIRVFLAATLNDSPSQFIGKGVTTYSPDQVARRFFGELQIPQAFPIPPLFQFGDPLQGVVEAGSFYIPDCGVKPIARNVVPTDSSFETLTIPPDSVFEYMTLREINAGQDSASPWDPGKRYNAGDLVTYNNHVYQCITIEKVLGAHPDTSPENWALTGQLNIPFLSPSGSSPINCLILGNTPSVFHLVYPKGGFDPNYSSSGLGFFAPDWQSFFYQDDQRAYFVTPQSLQQAALTNANNTAPLYNSDALRGMSGTTSIISSSPHTATQLRFATFWHPHVCAFIKTLNQFGFPRLLSLLTQARTNDGGIASGFVLSLPSTPNSVTPVLSPGSLYAEGQLYQTPPGTQPIVPPAHVGKRAFPLPVFSPMFCGPTGNFYYIPSSQTGPNSPGDAYITTIATLHGQIISLDWNASWPERTIFEEIYSPNSDYVIPPYPTEAVDFSLTGAYATYNWEIFFHIPYLIATLFSQNQQFSEAKKWFEYIFNPMSSSTDSMPARFWNFLPFHQCSPRDVINGQIQSLLLQLDGPMITFLSPNGGPPGTSVTIEGANFGLVQGTSTVTFGGAAVAPTSWDDTQITFNVPNGAVTGDIVVTVAGTASNSEPFNVGPTLGVFEAPDCDYDVHVQLQQWTQTPFDPFVIARMRTIAFRKNLVMRYLDNLIAWGDYLFTQNTRESINEATQIYVLADQILGDKPVTIPPQGTIQDYSYQDLVNQGLDDFSNALVTLESTFPFSTGSAISGTGGTGTGSLNGAGAQSFYFCIPSNDQLLAYWDTVADRLYKIRHCMNIQGQVEELALFAPPINPALLVQAAAAGVDLSSVLNEINTPVPNYRFTFMLQKALELCAEVRSLGASLLSALEKNDAEGLSLLRSTQEIALLQAVLQIKQSQVDEANKNLAGLQASQATTLYRQQYYQGLLSGGLSSFEQTYIAELQGSRAHQENSEMADLLGSILALVPEISGSVSIPGPGGSLGFSFGGQELFHNTAAVSQWQKAIASFHSYQANMASIMGGWDRRSTEWNFQLQTATKELTQIQSQIDAATVRVQIAQTDVQNQQLQITNAQAVLDFLNSKYTNQELYGWMISQISATYFQCYRMAYGLAKRAEACLRFELALTDSNFIQFGYWDSLRNGLQAGEGLYADLKRMEISYLDQNQRKYEITKYISLIMFDPLALIALKETGQCLISLPEALFDMDYPGHYLRQIESVSLTMPCVTGPYTSVNCKLTLVSSKIRVDAAATSPQDYGQEAHFITNFAATQSIVTSSAQNDNGMFELNFRDDRYLPFQGAGVISQWLIELPQDCNAFDFETISDLVINLKYTARDGGDALRAVAKQAATLSGPTDQTSLSTDSVSFPPQNNLVRFFSLRHEFPTEWYKFLNPLATDTAQTMLLPLTKERFPFQYRGKKISINQVDLLLKFKDIYNAQQFTTGTPQGDFAAGGGAPGLLNVYVTPGPPPMGQPLQAPTQPPLNGNRIQLGSNPVNFNGAPYGSSGESSTSSNSSFPLNLGLCWLQVFTTANYIGSVAPTLVDTNNHLLPGIIEDVFLVCHYRTT